MSRAEFTKAMQALYDTGDDEAIERAASMMVDIRVEREIEKLFADKAPNASPQASEKLALEIKRLKIPPEAKPKLVEGIYNGEAYQIHKGLTKKGPVKLQSLVNSAYPGAKELLPWFVRWDASVDKSKRGIASSEIWMVLAGKNGKTPTKGDAVVDGKAVEVKSYKKGFNFEYTVSGQQHNGVPIRDNFVKQAEALFKQKNLYRKYWVNIEKEQGWVMPLGTSRTKGVGLNHAHMTGPMNSFCFYLTKHGGMSVKQVDTKIKQMVNSSMKTSVKMTAPIWDGKKFNRYNFLKLWASCGFDYYKKEEGFDMLSMIDKDSLEMLTIRNGQEMLSYGDKLKPAGIAMNGMPGQNSSVSAGSIKI